MQSRQRELLTSRESARSSAFFGGPGTPTGSSTQSGYLALVLRDALLAHRLRSAAEPGQPDEQVPQDVHANTVAVHSLLMHPGASLHDDGNLVFTVPAAAQECFTAGRP